jgi:hypothetical protein
MESNARLAPRGWMRRTRRDVRGAGAGQWAVLSSVTLGVILGALSRHSADHHLQHGDHFFRLIH